MEKPNILIFIVDEKRYPPTYESPALKEWRRKNLLFEQEMIDQGIVFHNHYTASTACAPSRASLHTGQYPSVHGVTQTDGLAIQATDSEMTWLPEFTVPTMGNYFRQAGYKSILKGKWHVTDGSIRLNAGEPLLTFDADGTRLPEREEFYLEKNPLHNWGYDRWIGPEPHGTLPQNSGSSVPPPEKGRDIGYRNQVIKELEHLEKSEDPWFLVSSFVNPHDITLFGALTEGNPQYDFPIDLTLPEKLFTSEFKDSFKDPLTNKPEAQKYWRDHYHEIVQPIPELEKYWRAYYTMQKEIDNNLMQVWQKFKKSSDYEKTIVVFISDHGDLLSAHGNSHQKWFNAYEESIHVPLIIRSPLLGDRHHDVSTITSHLDLLPTLLGLAGIDQEKIRQELGEKFSLNLPLVGRDLSAQIKKLKRHIKNEPIYFYTEDNPTSGPHNTNALGKTYDPVPDPASLEAVIMFYQGTKWKLTNYYSTDSTWRSQPGEILNELYNLDCDPTEVNNLYGVEKWKNVQKELARQLAELSFKYRQGS